VNTKTEQTVQTLNLPTGNLLKHMASRLQEFAFSTPTTMRFEKLAFSKYCTMKKHAPKK